MIFNFAIRELGQLLCMIPRMMEEYVRRSVHSCLIYSLYSEETDSSKSAYQLLWTNLCCNVANDEIKKRGPVYMIETARKRFSIDLVEVLTFLKWFIENCSTEEAKTKVFEAHKNPNILETYKRSIIQYKNSLLVSNHFKNNLNTVSLLSDLK